MAAWRHGPLLGLWLLCAPLLAEETSPAMSPEADIDLLLDMPLLDLPPLDLPSLLSVEWLGGNDGRDDLFVDLDLSLGGPRLLLSVTQSRVDNSLSDYTTRSYVAGLYSDPLQTLNVGIEARQWGLTNNIRSRGLRAFFAYNARDASLSLRPQFRQIDLTTSDFCQQFPECPDQWRIQSRGISIDGNYYLDAWGFTLGISLQNYDRDLQPLASRALIIRLFTPLALELATGLEDYGINAGIRYAFHGGLLSVNEYRSTSAVDGLVSWLTNARLSIDLDPHWRLGLNGGLLRMPALEDSDSVYAGLGLGYAW